MAKQGKLPIMVVRDKPKWKNVLVLIDEIPIGTVLTMKRSGKTRKSAPIYNGHATNKRLGSCHVLKDPETGRLSVLEDQSLWILYEVTRWYYPKGSRHRPNRGHSPVAPKVTRTKALELKVTDLTDRVAKLTALLEQRS